MIDLPDQIIGDDLELTRKQVVHEIVGLYRQKYICWNVTIEYTGGPTDPLTSFEFRAISARSEMDARC